MRPGKLLAVAFLGFTLAAVSSLGAAEPKGPPGAPGPMAAERLRSMIQKMKAEGKSDAEILAAVTKALERFQPPAAPGRPAAGLGRGARAAPGFGRGLGLGRGAGVGRGLRAGPGLGLGPACPYCPLCQKMRAQIAPQVQKMLKQGKSPAEIRSAIREKIRARLEKAAPGATIEKQKARPKAKGKKGEPGTKV